MTTRPRTQRTRSFSNPAAIGTQRVPISSPIPVPKSPIDSIHAVHAHIDSIAAKNQRPSTADGAHGHQSKMSTGSDPFKSSMLRSSPAKESRRMEHARVDSMKEAQSALADMLRLPPSPPKPQALPPPVKYAPLLPAVYEPPTSTFLVYTPPTTSLPPQHHKKRKRSHLAGISVATSRKIEQKPKLYL